ncbi:MAG: enoyl-CoA hydratase-related protein [Candidatus Brocadiaceae bacterium]
MNIESERVKTERKKGVGIIIFNRPMALNTLDIQMMQELGDSLSALEKDEQVRAIIITGERNFCAGANLKKMKEINPSEAEAFVRQGHKVCNQIETMGKPVIAAVNGYALGGGCELVLACDIRIASEGAKLGQPEVSLGIIPGIGGTQRLTRLVGIGKAKELILTGAIIEAREAETIGLVNRVVKETELMEKAEEIAQTMARKSPIALKMAKTLINEEQELERGLEKEIAFFTKCFATQDRLEGINAFLEKRKPVFKGI